MGKPKPIPREDWIDPPKGVSRQFKAGWRARLLGKINSDCKIIVPDKYDWTVDGWVMVEEGKPYWEAITRKQDWHRGYLQCSRALGRIRKAKVMLEETKRLTAEHDWLVDLAEEFAA